MLSGTITFDTDLASASGNFTINGVNFVGGNVEKNEVVDNLGNSYIKRLVIVFSFDSIYLSKDVTVNIIGSIPLAIVSRSSIFIDCPFIVKAGSLGGFPGGKGTETILSTTAGEIGTTFNNGNGPGSGNVRVYLQTIETSATVVKEVQRIITTADSGQTLGGYFTLKYKGDVTSKICHSATAEEVQREIEIYLPHAGKVNVWRTERNSEEGYMWTITYLTAIGNIPQIEVTSYLTGIGCNVITDTFIQGNNLGGSFTVSFLSQTTAPIPYDAAPKTMQTIMERDIKNILNVEITRNDPYGICDNGLCSEGPDPSWGYKWTLTITTYQDNISPDSPNSYEFDKTYAGPTKYLTVNYNSLTGLGAMVTVYDFHKYPGTDSISPDIRPQPFSLSYGGGGGSYGGLGGIGHGRNPQGSKYNNDLVEILVGGSGGALGGSYPQDIIPYDNPSGKGGDGGGAMQINAINDIVLGPNSKFLANGGDGGGGNEGGGGGSGGAIVIVCGGSISNSGSIEVAGGKGGFGTGSNAKHGGGGGGGRIKISSQVYGGSATSSVHASGGLGGGAVDKLQNGQDGSIYLYTRYDIMYSIENTGGVFGTNSCLRLEGGEKYLTPSNVIKRSPHIYDGPQHLIPNLPGFQQPRRVTYYIRIGNLKYGESSNNWGGFFAIHGPNSYGIQSDELTSTENTMIGVAFIDGSFRHAANFNHDPSGMMSREDTIFKRNIRRNRWYKIDIIINWVANKYEIRVDDDVTSAINIPFIGSSIFMVGLYNYDYMTVWYDEIYAGADNHMSFRCPISIDDNSNLLMDRPKQTQWNVTALGPSSSLHTIIRHDSHLSRREMYKHNFGELVFSDGAPHVAFDSDIKYKYLDGDFPTVSGDVRAAVLNYVPGKETGDSFLVTGDTRANEFGDWGAGTEDGDGNTGRYYWYGDHINPEGSLYPELYGGVASCSTTDFVSWRNEGIMLHSVNVSDPSNSFSSKLRVQRPKVIYNDVTSSYLMWIQVDKDVGNTRASMGYVGVASSKFPAGPFIFNSTFLPNKNETHDQTLIKLSDGRAMLARTYYATVDYIMPQPIMQPLWESVKNPDGSVNFGLNYHRAWYEPNYDDYHDIYIQRWRKENVTWHLTWKKNGTALWEEMGLIDKKGVKVYQTKVGSRPITVSEQFGGVSEYKKASPLGQIEVSTFEKGLLITTKIQSTDIRHMFFDQCCNGVNNNCCNLFLPSTQKLEMLTRLLKTIEVEDSVNDPWKAKFDNLNFLKDCKVPYEQGVQNGKYIIYFDKCVIAREEPYDDQYTGGSWDSLVRGDEVREQVGGSGYTEIWDTEKDFDGTGDPTVGAVLSKFFDPDDPVNSFWSPSSVPAVVTQPWHKNYYDANIADNPIIPALPDQLIALPHIVQKRRAKYVAICKLTDDYMKLTVYYIFFQQLKNNLHKYDYY